MGLSHHKAVQTGRVTADKAKLINSSRIHLYLFEWIVILFSNPETLSLQLLKINATRLQTTLINVF